MEIQRHYVDLIGELAKSTLRCVSRWQASIRCNWKDKSLQSQVVANQLLEKEGFATNLYEELDQEIEDSYFSIQHSRLHTGYSRLLVRLIHDIYSATDYMDLDKIYAEFGSEQIDPNDRELLKDIEMRMTGYIGVISKKLHLFSPSIFYNKVYRQRHNLPPLTDPQLTPAKNPVNLTWNCKPAVAGYIISEFIRAGYIEPPTTNGELSYAKLGAICSQLFTIADHSPTVESWRKVLNPESNTLPDHKRVKLNLPDLGEII